MVAQYILVNHEKGTLYQNVAILFDKTLLLSKFDASVEILMLVFLKLSI